MKAITNKFKNWKLNNRQAILGAMGAAALMTSVGSAYAADKVNLGALRFTSHSGGFVAFEKGYFKEQGIDVQFKFFQAAQPIAVAIASGDIDYGVTAITGGLLSLADKGVLKIIGGALKEEAGIDGSHILASNKAYAAGLTSPAKLKGKSFAITQMGSSFHYNVSQIVGKEGIALSDVKLLPLQKVGLMIAAIKSGQADAMVIVPHIAKPLARAGKVKIIGKLNDYAEYQVTTVFTSTKNATDKRDLTKRFLIAYAKGVAEFNRVMLNQAKNPAETEALTKLIHKYVYKSRPYAKASKGIQAGAMRISEGAKLDVADVKKQLAWFQSQNLAPKSLTFDKLVDSSYSGN
jgi:NitT/TauT family transport system substrate-binding protein